MSSRAGINAYPGGCAYNASKFGLIGLSEASLLDLRHDGIRVSYVMPGRVNTGLAAEPPEFWHLTPEDVANVVVEILSSDPRAIVNRVEIRPSVQPPFPATNLPESASEARTSM